MSDSTDVDTTSDHDADAPEPADDTTSAVASISEANADIAEMGYEQARDELASIVSTLEGGRAPLEQSMRLWERGEALADHCTRWLDGAQTRIEDAVARRQSSASSDNR